MDRLNRHPAGSVPEIGRRSAFAPRRPRGSTLSAHGLAFTGARKASSGSSQPRDRGRTVIEAFLLGCSSTEGGTSCPARAPHLLRLGVATALPEQGPPVNRGRNGTIPAGLLGWRNGAQGRRPPATRNPSGARLSIAAQAGGGFGGFGKRKRFSRHTSGMQVTVLEGHASLLEHSQASGRDLWHGRALVPSGQSTGRT